MMVHSVFLYPIDGSLDVASIEQVKPECVNVFQEYGDEQELRSVMMWTVIIVGYQL